MSGRRTALILYPTDWLQRREKEWDPLSAAAAAAGLRAIVADWESIAPGGDDVTARGVLVRHPGEPAVTPTAEVSFRPDIVLTPWGVDWEHQELWRSITRPPTLHSESTLLDWLDGKCELERCLRAHEAAGGRAIPRPETLLWDEIGAEHAWPAGQSVIVKPDRDGQCRGIEIVPRDRLLDLAKQARSGARAPFVAQRLVDDVFLYRGRRWDVRLHAMVSSLTPLRYRVYRAGVAKTAAREATPNSRNLDEWLNAESHLEGVVEAENLALGSMLAAVEDEHVPLTGFWNRVDALMDALGAAIAHADREWPHDLGGGFLFMGLDLIVERAPAGGFDLRLLELNSHPGLGWEGECEPDLQASYREWFGDLAALVPR